MDPDALIDALSQRTFLIYSGVTAFGIIVLAFFSDRPVGREYVWIDLGLCALFGEIKTVAFSLETFSDT